MKTEEERLTRGRENFINCTDYDDAIKAMKEYAIEYHEQQVKNLNIPSIGCRLFSVNTVLHTKDGRIIGNGIITGHEDKLNVIKTDYGNTVRFTDEEVAECFYIAYSDLTDEEKQYMREAIGDHKHSVEAIDIT